MHGNGKLTHTDGTIIQTSWEKGKKHGIGVIKKPKIGKEIKTVFNKGVQHVKVKYGESEYTKAIVLGFLFTTLEIAFLIIALITK